MVFKLFEVPRFGESDINYKPAPQKNPHISVHIQGVAGSPKPTDHELRGSVKRVTEFRQDKNYLNSQDERKLVILFLCCKMNKL